MDYNDLFLNKSFPKNLPYDDFHLSLTIKDQLMLNPASKLFIHVATTLQLL